MRNILLFFFIVIASFYWWSDFVGSGRLLKMLDGRPDTETTSSALFYLGRYYELFNRHGKAVEVFDRVAERFPDSPRGLEAQFALATSLEKVAQPDRAIAEYRELLEKYEGNKYSRTVENRIDILLSR